MAEYAFTSYSPIGPDGEPTDSSAARWGHERRIDFPVDPRQSCAFCGSDDWAVLYPMLTVLPWRPTADMVLPWFWCACTACAALIESADRDDLVARMVDPPFRDREASIDELAMFDAFRSEPRIITRAEALTRRPALTPRNAPDRRRFGMRLVRDRSAATARPHAPAPSLRCGPGICTDIRTCR